MFWAKSKPMLGAIFAAIATLASRVPASPQESNRPGMAYPSTISDIMGLLQLRHFKQWFAGSAGNWPLAAYEARQIGLEFSVAAKSGDPAFGHHGAARLFASGRRCEGHRGQKQEDFSKGFERLTTACNACHIDAQVEFVKIRMPTSSPFTNQIFPPE
jgi:hypothetical protein